jgi:hypothetical protein
MLKSHRSAVIRKLAPTAPLVRARVLAAVAVRRPAATPTAEPVPLRAKTIATPSRAKTIATLAASLSRN